jgi:hypothetical protein
MRDSGCLRPPHRRGTYKATSRSWRVNGRRGRVPSSPAFADAPPGQGLEALIVVCADRTITVVGTPGDSASRWIDDQHMVQLLITFTPTGGAEIVVKAYGKKTGLASKAVTCTVAFPDGTARVVRAPVPPGG